LTRRIRRRGRPGPRAATGTVALLLALTLSACGGGSESNTASSTTSATGSSSATGGQAQTQKLTATETNFKIALDSTDLTAGTYDITVVNDGSATHDLAVEENGTTKATSDSLSPGQSTTLTVDLDAGEYVFYCAIDGHRAMGMELPVQVR
jgi:plastocyanin